MSTLSELAPGRGGLLTVSVFGLGYVGCVSAACLAARGDHVVGIDANRDKMEFLRRGQSPVVEERIGELTAEVVGAGRLTVRRSSRVPIAESEMTKYVDNRFHALEVTFGNEIGALCAALRPDAHEVMDIFLTDTQLNISSAYLRPGPASAGRACRRMSAR